MSLSKKDIADGLVREMEITHAQALQLTNDFFNQIQLKLAEGEEVKLSSFGNFNLREKSARPGRNPKTGKEVMISARRVVSFKAGPKLKKLTQEG
ncbi:integration host factor subunit alpha [Candidatus Thioglobus sp.]|jgi:integration host factor subunit alpha|uniref:integration host factor subunit alpha n=1 Tax=Candidatus Thioglobus sp. TaxID=2026721 RepID=UPI00176BE8AC|nr:integration host factor subunit alpha [Candidatus Thioglobus sp.]HIL04231.1 integration host factor subunit alpha [Candidatus Thioglobus autotrophicus]HIB28716.1 integration host factor subunit alpha [Candidatus Thioglobus sp.]HIB31202.1 integration host factor subunit alpha [Candidatus Thioglobus sp.]HIB97338.1 integration host factor subunit alpha [Candidatus Thioglobus sp.]HIF48016.1 integration host factor subunit alpha [Candidatus Thioglobus sp.]